MNIKKLLFLSIPTLILAGLLLAKSDFNIERAFAATPRKNLVVSPTSFDVAGNATNTVSVDLTGQTNPKIHFTYNTTNLDASGTLAVYWSDDAGVTEHLLATYPAGDSDTGVGLTPGTITNPSNFQIDFVNTSTDTSKTVHISDLRVEVDGLPEMNSLDFYFLNPTQTSLELHWETIYSTYNANALGTYYEVFENGASVGATTSDKLEITGLTPGSSHTYTLVASNSGYYATSSPLIAQTLAPTTTASSTLTAPNLFVTNLTQTSFVLHWNNVPSATSYEVFKDGTSYETTTATSSSITGLTASTTYNMLVVATDGTNFATSSPLAETTDPTSGGGGESGSGTRYVATTGSDSGNDCLTQSSPCATIAYAIDQANPGETIQLLSDFTTGNQITVDKSIILEGNNHTISPNFTKTDNDNNSVLSLNSVMDGATVQNLVIDGTGGTNLHGLQVFNSGNGSDVVTLWRVTSENNDHSGINVVSSKVVATDITTSGNGWHGIDVDHSSDTSLPQPWIKIAGMNHLGELPPLPLIYFDHFDPSQVQIDNPSLYTYINHYVTSTDRAYFLAITIPTPTSPRWIKAPSTILGAYTNVNLVTPTWDAPTSTIVDHYEYSFTRPSDNNWSTPSNIGNVTSIPNQVFGTAGANQGEEGPWQFRVRAVDALGNTSAWATSSILIYDHTAPTDTIDTPVDYVNTTLPFTISGTYHDINGTTIQSGVGRLHIYISANGHTLANPFIVNSSQLNSASGTYTYTLTQSDLNKLVTELNLQNGQQFTIKAWVYDRANNWTHTDKTFTVDTTAPAKPVITNPLNRPNLIQQQWFKTTPILDKWNAVTQDVNGNPENMGSYQIAYQYDDGHTFSGSTCSATTTINGHWVGCRDVAGTQRNHAPGLNEEGGVTIWVRAIDIAGNVGAWSDPVHYFYDHTAPNTTLNISSVVNGQFTVSGTSTDNLALNRVYVQLVKDSSPRCGGTTVHFISIPFSTSSPWSVNYDIASLYNVNATTSLCGPGNYRATAAVTDMAGNTYQLPWSTTFVVPAIDNIAPLSYFTNATNSPVDEGYYNSDFLVGYGVTDETELNSVNVSLRNYNTWGWAAGCYDNLNEATGTKIDEGTCTMGTNVPDGKYYVSIFGQDTALNFSQNATRTIIIDKTLPTLDITSATTTSSTTLAFSGYVSDTNLNYYYCWLTLKGNSTEILGTRNGDCVTKWAGGADHFGTSTSPVELGGFDISDILDGDYTIHLIAKDKAGNQSNEVSYDTTIDRTSTSTGSGTGTGTGTGNGGTPQLLSFGAGSIPYTQATYQPVLPATQGSVLGAAAFQFTQNLKLGSIGDEVKALQEFLNLKGFTLAADGAGSSGNETNYFGFRTKDALSRYQEANPVILTNVGIMNGVGTGNFFASTREFVNNVLLNDATTSEYLTNH